MKTKPDPPYVYRARHSARHEMLLGQVSPSRVSYKLDLSEFRPDRKPGTLEAKTAAGAEDSGFASVLTGE